MDARVLTADPSHSLKADEILGGVPVRRVRAWPRDTDYCFAPAVTRAIEESRPDLVHVQCYQTLVAPAALFAAARLRVPYVLTFHGGGHSSSWRNRIRVHQLKALRPFLARASVLIATAEWEIEYYSSLLGLDRRKFALIPNGGDFPAREGEFRKAPGTLIASLGRAERFKGHHRVLAALPYVLRELPDARLWIAGEGPYEPELRKMAVQLGVADRVEIRPIPDRAEYARQLAGASVAALLSDFETHPMAALEAIDLGIPILVGDTSGLAELAAKGLADAVSLSAETRHHAAELVRLVRDPPAHRAIVGVSSWDSCADTHASLYAQVLEARAGCATAG
jgi:glycosyltransferase involved in cell wall biosynthesis